jgi:ubiquinone/menaquinone biosynthesis C-methylase UbiE
MLDHFGILAPFYDRLIQPPDTGRLQALLELPIPGRLLDAGGGTGRVTHQLRPLVGELVLSDASAGMLGQAQRKSNLTPLQAQAEMLPFPADAFERVLVVDALHHFHDQALAIADLVRVLRPGGRLVIEEPDLNRWSVKLIALAEKLALMRSHFLYPAEIRDLLQSHGLQARIEGDGGMTAWVVAEK